jgi:hypothetical protein
MHTRYSLFGSMAKSRQDRYTAPNKSTYKISTSNQLREILYNDSEDTLVLQSTVESRYYNYYTGGSTSPANYGYEILWGKFVH